MTLSIITVNKNNDIELEKTIASVRDNIHLDYEYIIIDGCSTDKSIEIIKQNTDIISFWSSEKDNGIYSAMNKGIRKANGDYCLFLNSGDCINPQNDIDVLLGNTASEAYIFYSDVIIADKGHLFVREFPESVDVNFFVSGTLNHQNTIIRRSLFDTVGMYDERMKICADWKFFLSALYKNKAIFEYCEIPFCEYSSSGISSKGEFEKLKNREMDEGILEVLGEIGPSIVELRQYRNSIFGNINSLFGVSKYLVFILKVFRFFARRVPFLRKK